MSFARYPTEAAPDECEEACPICGGPLDGFGDCETHGSAEEAASDARTDR